jgi:hypothetical protein
VGWSVIAHERESQSKVVLATYIIIDDQTMMVMVIKAIVSTGADVVV